MLDKSVPFYTIIMKRPYINPPELGNIPEEFSVRTYEAGDENGWAEIESSVLEFDDVKQALDCHKGYNPCIDQLKKRQWFVVNSEGVLVSTATAWWEESERGHIPVVHALACRPEFQGKGLGKIAAIKMLESFYKLEKDREVWLDTQTWSYKAIGLYLELGFVPVKTEVFNGTKNEYSKALPILKDHMKKEYFEKFVKAAK